MRCLFLLIPVLCSMSCSKNAEPPNELVAGFPESFSITVSNPSAALRTDELLMLRVADVVAAHPLFNARAFVALDGNREIPSQAVDDDGDGIPERVAILCDLASGEQKEITLRFAATGSKQRQYPRRAYAELSHKIGGTWRGDKYVGGEFHNVKASGVRNWHTDHTEYFRYEGPGWESDKVGYRFYLDWRNAIDIFGKKTPEMVLHRIGLDGYDSYHEMSDWGMDILKVGESLGIGSIGIWLDGKAQRVNQVDSVWCEIVADGPIYAQIRTRYYGWHAGPHRIDLVSNLSISAGSRMTRHKVEISDEVPNLCTGLVKESGVDYLSSEAGNGSSWQYVANYGKQSLAGDRLGMAVLFRAADVIEQTEDDLNRVVVLRPQDGKVEYYFLAAWEKEPGGLSTRDEFVKYLEAVVENLNAPVEIHL